MVLVLLLFPSQDFPDFFDYLILGNGQLLSFEHIFHRQNALFNFVFPGNYGHGDFTVVGVTKLAP